jgi:hypothetical protein
MRYDVEIVQILGELPMDLKSRVVEDYEIFAGIAARSIEEKFDPDKLDFEALVHSLVQNVIHPLKDLESIYNLVQEISGNLQLKGFEFKDDGYKFDEEEYSDTTEIVSAFERMLEANNIDIMRHYRE